MQEQSHESPPTGPFQILHNYRFNPPRREKPKRKISASQRYQHIPEFTMRTRKMTAELQIRVQLQPQENVQNEQQVSNNPEPPMKIEEPEQFLLKNEDDLENAIPFSQLDKKDVLYDVEENSHASNYSKLERALFGFGMNQEIEQQ